VSNKIQSLELASEMVNSKIEQVVSEVEIIKQRTQPTYVLSQELKSPSTISANAELFLTMFNNEQNSVHPMIYLKFAKKFVEVSGDNWEIQLLHLIRYL